MQKMSRLICVFIGWSVMRKIESSFGKQMKMIASYYFILSQLLFANCSKWKLYLKRLIMMSK